MLKKKIESFVEKFKKLHGDPHYVAFGIAIGVFAAFTPTIPFHTILALILAFLFKASKPAVLLSVWICNPFTVIFFYIACYKTGYLFFENSTDALRSVEILIGHFKSDINFAKKIICFMEFIKANLRTFMIMNVGGVVLGLPAGLITYFLTKNIIIKIRRK